MPATLRTVKTHALKVVREPPVSLAAACDVVIEGRRYHQIFHNQIAVQCPDKLIGFAGFWIGIS